MKNLSIVLIALIVISSGACSSKPKKEKGTTEQEVYEMAQEYLDGKNWDAAIQTLQLLEENFPFGTYGEQSQLELIFAHYQADNFEEAVATAERFIRLHPQHRRVDYAYYMRGLASFNQERTFLSSFFGSDNTNKDPGAARDSFDFFSQFIQRFPDSAYAPDAQKRMIYLRNVLARAEIHAANYYFTRGAYLAALNRGAYVVENFPGTPSVPDALAVMAQAYYLLGRNELAEDTVKLLAHNFPEHPALDEQGKFDEKYIQGEKHRSLVSRLTFGLFDRVESRGFDTRDIYNPEFIEPADLEAEE